MVQSHTNRWIQLICVFVSCSQLQRFISRFWSSQRPSEERVQPLSGAAGINTTSSKTSSLNTTSSMSPLLGFQIILII